ncbi:hypothetical protein WG954_01665 [Lacibacter sp. H375]|uniref:hypothetical protein n=1 Tax=Lacibacter sp. H375 TaxID=3133424 RepID=UPI0030C4A4B5
MPYAPPFGNVGPDKQVFIYGAMSIWKGQIPYKTFFDHKPPLIFLLLSLAWPLKAWGYFGLGVLSKWVASLFLYKTGQKMLLVNVWLFPLIFLICLLPPFILISGTLTREYTACFLAILFSVILLNQGEKYILTGFICALIFHMQQEELLLAFPFVMYHLFNQTKQGSRNPVQLILKRIGMMIIGFSLLTIPLLLWIAVNGALADYWEQSYLFNLLVYESRRPILYKVTAAFQILFHSRYLFLVFPLLIIHGYYIIRATNVSLHVTSFFTILFALISKTFAGRIFDHFAAFHYLLTVSAIVTVSAIIVFKEWQPFFSKRYLSPLSFTFAAGLFFVMWKNSFHNIIKRKHSDIGLQVEDLTKELQKIRNKDGQLYVMGSTPFLALNNNLNVLSPTKWIYTTQYRQHLINFDTDGRVIKEIIAGLDRYRTTYVLDFYKLQPVDKKDFQEQWEDYLKKNYTELYQKDNFILFKRKINDAN